MGAWDKCRSDAGIQFFFFHNGKKGLRKSLSVMYFFCTWYEKLLVDYFVLNNCNK